MCVVSMITDDWSRRFPNRFPDIHPWVNPSPLSPPPAVSREEFDRLKHELEALKKLIEASKVFDKETGQPDCETVKKAALFRKLAEMVGVDLSDLTK